MSYSTSQPWFRFAASLWCLAYPPAVMSSMTFRDGFRRDPSLKGAQIWTIWERGLGGGLESQRNEISAKGHNSRARWYFSNVSKQLSLKFKKSYSFLHPPSRLLSSSGKRRACVSVLIFHPPLPRCQQPQRGMCVRLSNWAFRVSHHHPTHRGQTLARVGMHTHARARNTRAA